MQKFNEIPHREQVATESYFERIRSSLDKDEKVEYLVVANMGGEVIVAVTDKKLVLRPSPSMFKSSDKRAVADITYDDIDVMRKGGLRDNKIEIESNGTKYGPISDMEGLAEYVAKKAGLEKVRICPDCGETVKYQNALCLCGKILAKESKGKGMAKKTAGIGGAIAGGLGGSLVLVLGIIFGGLFVILGALLCLTLIGAVIGIPAMIFGFFILLGSGVLGRGGILAGVRAGKWASGSKAVQIEWRRLKIKDR